MDTNARAFGQNIVTDNGGGAAFQLQLEKAAVMPHNSQLRSGT
jgi:hypothetical protein